MSHDTQSERRVCAHCAGFTLIELAVVVAIVGLVGVGLLGIVRPLLANMRLVETQAKLTKVEDAIAAYVLQNNRLPCPAAPEQSTSSPPFGFEIGSGSTGGTVPDGCGATANWQGIVPFRTLGIPPEWVVDSSDNYFTYAISPGFTRDPDLATAVVHERCRTADWYTADLMYKSGMYPPVLANKNKRKARFCCSGQNIGSDLDIVDADTVAVLASPRQTNATAYADVNISYPNPLVANTQVPAADTVAAPVYVLVSHGRHGGGGYNIATGGRFPFSSATAAEQENGGNTRRYVALTPMDKTGAERDNDDIVRWSTQDAIFSNHGESCSIP